MGNNRDDSSSDSSDGQAYLQKAAIDDLQRSLDRGEIKYDLLDLTPASAEMLGLKPYTPVYAVHIDQVTYLTAKDANYAASLLSKLDGDQLKKFKAGLLAAIATQTQIQWPGLLNYKGALVKKSFLGLFEREEMKGSINSPALFYILNQGSRTSKQHAQEKPTNSLVRLYGILETLKKVDEDVYASNLAFKASQSNEKK
jgi:hypothetical protein